MWNGLRESVVSFLMSGVMYYVWTIWSSGEDPEVVCLSSSAHNISIEQLSVEACGYLACLSSLILSTPCLSALLDSHQSVPLLYKYCYVTIASYPGLLTPAFVACGTNAGGRPGKTEPCGMTYLDVWRSGTFLLYSCKAAF